MNDSFNKKILACSIELGSGILECGGDVGYVESAVRKVCSAYGATKTDVFAITSSIIVTMTIDDETYTLTKRIKSPSTDFRKLEDLVDLVRKACHTVPDPFELETQIEKIRNKKVSHPVLECAGFALASGAFTIFFGGNWMDGLCAAFCGIMIFFISRFSIKVFKSKLIYYILCSFIAGMAALLLKKIGFCLNADKVMIGEIMLLIPGMALTNSFHDMFSGNTITGILRLLEALLQAGAIACGFALAVLTGGKIL